MINKSILSIERNLATEVGSISITGTASGVPVGGTTGQILAKRSDNSYDTHWINQQTTSTEFLLQTVYNGSGTTINKGEVVYIAGAQGNAIVVGEAIASLPHDSEVIGVALENIINGGYGSIVIHGIIDGLNTDSFSEGDRLYLSDSSYGQITNVEPSAPNHAVLIGYCVKKDILDGAIYVNVNAGEHLKELHDVNVDSAISGQYLFLDNDQIWKNKTIEYTDVSGLSTVLSRYVAKSGDTMTGKLNLPASTTGSAPINIGTGSAPTSPINGDIWLAGSNLTWKGTSSDIQEAAALKKANIFTRAQAIQLGATDIGIGLKITNLGTGECLRIEDESPEPSAFVVSNNGRVGIGQYPDASGGAALSVDQGGIKFNDGSIQITAATGYITSSQTGAFYAASNPSGFITGVNLSSYITSSQTGAFYAASNPSGFITGVDTSNFYTNNNPSGFITGINNLVYTTGDQVISGRKQFLDGFNAGLQVGSTTLYVGTGLVGINNEDPQAAFDVSGSVLFSQRPTVNGTGVMLSGDIDILDFYPNNNPSGFITGIQNLVYTTGNQTISGIKTFTDELYIKSLAGQIAVLHVESGKVGINNENPQASLDVSGSALFSERPTVNGTGILLSGDINISNFYPNDNPSGFITGIDTSNFVTGAQFLVYTTGDQVISGKKTFEQGFEAGSMLDLSTLYVLSGAVGINNENPQASLDVSGLALFSQRPIVNNTGVMLSGDIDTSNFYTNDNPSGFITGVNLSSYVTNSQTGAFYAASNPSGFITGVDTSNFYTNNNPSGYITGIQNLVYTTGDQTISGIKTFANDVTILGNFAVSGTTFINEVIDVTTTGIISGVTGVFQHLEADNIVYSQTNSYVVAQPGDDLIAKYAEAAALTPNGSAKSTANRASLIIMPGNYALSAELAVNVEFVDIVGLGAQTQKPAVFVKDNTLNVSANDVRVSGISVGVQRFTIAGNKSLQVFENCTGGEYSFIVGNEEELSGTFTNCTGGTYSFNAGVYGSVNGKFTDCTAGNYSFAGQSYGLANGTFTNCTGADGCFGGNFATGVFINCTAGNNSFGSQSDYGGASGTFTNCVAGTYSFGGSLFANCTIASKFTNCTAGNYSFAGNKGGANGVFTNCTGGVASFAGYYGAAGGTFTNCTGGDYSFGSYSGTANGTFKDCTGGEYSFGGYDGAANGVFIGCALTIGTFQTLTAPAAGTARMLNCIDGNGDIINGEVSA